MLMHVDIIVTGKVQGVGFRAGVKQKAQELVLVGWVANDPDGSVRIAIEGDIDRINELIVWCKQGTILSRVENVQATRGAWENFTDFGIRRS